MKKVLRINGLVVELQQQKHESHRKDNVDYFGNFGYYKWMNQSTRERKLPNHCNKPGGTFIIH